MNIFALYRENTIPVVGKVYPQGVTTLLTDFNGWNLCSLNSNNVANYSEFNFYFISEAVANGIILSQYENPMPRIAGMDATEDKVLTADEIELVQLAKEFVSSLNKKFLVRAKIREIKDFEDDLSDTKFLTELILAYIMEDWNFKAPSEKETHPFKTILNVMEGAVSGDSLRINSSDSNNKLINIINEEKQIAKLVREHYFGNKK